MRTKSQRWGKGVASKIPKPSASEARLDQQSEVDVFVVADALAIKPCLEPAWSVEELLSKVTDENRHEEINTGPPVGHEIW